MITLKTPEELQKMREGNRMVTEIMARLLDTVRPGIATSELDQLAEVLIRRRNAKPAFKGYRGYPATICASVNEVVVHGIPNDRVLREGDILSIDLGLSFEGYFADIARTVPVGQVSVQAQRLLEASRKAFFAGFNAAWAHNRVGDISAAVQGSAESMGYSVVRDFVGHGIGMQMHEEPQVPNFGEPKSGARLRVGMTLAIEPMLNIGGFEVQVMDDHWTVVTRDRSLSAHYENTVAVTENGPEILTMLAGGELV